VNKSGHHNKKKKVLIITYYWPPSGGSPVLRWLKFVKYLHEFGWEVTVYTPENPEPQAVDETLLSEVPENVTVLKKKIREPYAIFKRLLRKPKGKSLATAFISDNNKKSLFNEMSVWIRGNFFIPDARKFWIKPSIRYLTRYLREHPYDAIISTGPPHSLHLIAQGLKKNTRIPWLADFRDPWTNIDYYNQLKLTKRADRKHHQLEETVLRETDAIVTVSPTMTKEFSDMGARSVKTITNGFDTVPEGIAADVDNKTLTILHVGSMPESRNPVALWKVLGILARKNPEFQKKLRIELIGNVDYSIMHSLKENGLDDSLVKLEHMPNAEVLQRMSMASVLLLVINNTQNASGILTNKFFEYLSAKRPIIAIGPTNGDAAEILNRTDAGRMIDYQDEKGTEDYILSLIADFEKGNLAVDVKNIDNFSRRKLTASLAQILDSLVV
jgi:glycosyltransferase involved in cell wall biosynthesis